MAIKKNVPSPRPTLRRRSRKPLTVTGSSVVKTHPIREDCSLPMVIEPAVDGLDPLRWGSHEKATIEKLVQGHGAVLFRGFPISSAEEFHSFVSAISGEPLTYTERSSPRHAVGENIYTSTDHPQDQEIFPHNEHSYKQIFPLRLSFYCHRQPDSGGATPLTDCRKIYSRIRPEIRQRLEEKGYMYVRNFSRECGLPWETVFQTSDRAEVEDYCKKMDILFEWVEGSRLRTRQIRKVAARHPRNSEPVWFNHLTFFHVTTLEAATRDALLGQFAEEDLPNQTFYGDGSPLEPEVLEHLRSLYREETVRFEWQKGDVLLLDNMLVSHARDAFTGPRRVMVAMTSAVDWQQLTLPS